MSLKKKFKTEAAKVREGVWFVVITNSDGSVCRVRLARHGRSNPAWQVAFREHTKGVDTENLTDEEDDLITLRVFIESCLIDWENLQLEDDGNNLAFSKDEAFKLLSNPDWRDLYNDWLTKATTIGGFQATEDEAKN